METNTNAENGKASSSPRESLTIEDLTKWVATSAILCYIVGLLTTALYLQQLDISLGDIAPLKPRFAYTGALVIVFLSFATLPTLAWPAKGTRAGKVVSLLGPALALLLFLWLLYLYIIGDGWEMSAAVPALLLVVLSVLPPILLRRAWGFVSRDIFVMSIFSVLAFVVLICFLLLFADRAWPRIADQFGGGLPKRTQLILTADGVADARALGVKVDSGTRKSDVVQIIYEGEDFYALRLAGGSIVQIASKHVVGAITDTKRPRGRNIETVNHAAQQGVPEEGDELILIYSEPIAPHTILSGWSGTTIGVKIQLHKETESISRLTVWNETSMRQLNVGTVELRFETANHTKKLTFAGHLKQDGTALVITLSEPMHLAMDNVRTRLVWTPSSQVADSLGNRTRTIEVSEVGGYDPDF